MLTKAGMEHVGFEEHLRTYEVLLQRLNSTKGKWGIQGLKNQILPNSVTLDHFQPWLSRANKRPLPGKVDPY